jgi:hypothetical protein
MRSFALASLLGLLAACGAQQAATEKAATSTTAIGATTTLAGGATTTTVPGGGAGEAGLAGRYAAAAECAMTDSSPGTTSCTRTVLELGTDGDYQLYGASVANATDDPPVAAPQTAYRGKFTATTFTATTTSYAAYTDEEAKQGDGCGTQPWAAGTNYQIENGGTACAALHAGTAWPALAGQTINATLTADGAGKLTVAFESPELTVGPFAKKLVLTKLAVQTITSIPTTTQPADGTQRSQTCKAAVDAYAALAATIAGESTACNTDADCAALPKTIGGICSTPAYPVAKTAVTGARQNQIDAYNAEVAQSCDKTLQACPAVVFPSKPVCDTGTNKCVLSID